MQSQPENDINPVPWIILCAIVGAVGLTFLMGTLIEGHDSYTGDMHVWVYAAIPTGFILGGVTADTIVCHLNHDFWRGGISNVLFSLPITWFYVNLFRNDLENWTLDIALRVAGIGLLWSGVLMSCGIFLICKAVKQRKEQNK